MQQKRVFGRIESPDSRDELFPVSSVVHAPPPQLREKYWWADGWWGDQGSTSHCVAYSWLHLVEDGPVIQNADAGRAKPLILPEKLYTESQKRDPWSGENYAGTSVRAAAKILKDLGIIKEYRWAQSVTDVINTVMTVGPMVVGTKWKTGMNTPSSDGIMRVTGRDMGGHAYVINGVNLDKELFRVKNSWGKQWGKQGYAFIKISDFEKLLNTGGEACIAFEKVLTESLDWSKVRAPGVYRD